jgi:hypothetical protein
MDKAKLLEVQWQVRDRRSLDTTVEVEPQQQQLFEFELRNLPVENDGQ